MSITKELRELPSFGSMTIEGESYDPLREMVCVSRHDLLAIADRIDAEHDQMRDFCERLESAATDREDVTLWGVDYTALPIDADGKPVHIDDVMEWPTTGETFEVVGIGDGTLFYIEDGNELADWTGASTKRHHVPTVEDVLRGFTDAVLEWAGKSGTVAEVGTWSDVAADFIAKLRLREDA